MRQGGLKTYLFKCIKQTNTPRWFTASLVRYIFPFHYYFLLFTLFFFLLSSLTIAQKITLALDRDKILLGEQVTLQVKVEDINPRTSFLTAWFNFPDTANHIELVKKTSIDTVEVNGYANYLQSIILTSFDSGKWNLTPLQLTLKDKESGKQTILKANDISLEVLPVDVSNLKQYHAIKDIIEVEVNNNPVAIAIIITIAILAAIFLLRLLRNKNKISPAPTKKVIIGSPLEWAMEQIRLLQNEDLPAHNQSKLFYTRLDEVYREYFHQQLNLRSLQLTGDELMIQLKVFLQQEEVRTQFYQLLRLVSAVKFAKYIPQAVQNDEAITIAKKTIHFIDQESQRINKQNAY